MSESALRIGVIYPSVLGTYGDTGNSLVLKKRAEMRGIDAEIVTVGLSDPIPEDLDIYTLGGGEDSAQQLAAKKLREHTGFARAAERGAPIFAVCASLQILGEQYTDARGEEVAGLGLLDLVTVPMGKRAIGELLEEPLIEGVTDLLTGFENHGGGTILGEDAAPLGRVIHGVGNREEPPGVVKYSGAVQGNIVATYLHGPALARNPQLADLLLGWAVEEQLEPLVIPQVEALRAKRIAALNVVGGVDG